MYLKEYLRREAMREYERILKSLLEAILEIEIQKKNRFIMREEKYYGERKNNNINNTSYCYSSSAINYSFII